MGENEIESDQEDAKAGRENSLPLPEVIARQDDGQEEEIEKSDLVMNEESDGDNPEENDDDQCRLEMPESQ
jgi:hypothetical protein